jgi:predicted RNase H-like HicB family nuclease
MHIRVVLEYDKQAKSYAAYCPELPGCTSCGDTQKEAMKNIQEAIELYLEPSTRVHFPRNAKIKELAI